MLGYGLVEFCKYFRWNGADGTGGTTNINRKTISRAGYFGLALIIFKDKPAGLVPGVIARPRTKQAKEPLPIGLGGK